MEIIDILFYLVVVIGLSIFALFVFLKLIFVPILWYRYDKPIQKYVDDFEVFKQKHREDSSDRGITTEVLARQIGHEEQKVDEKLKVLKMKRQHFLDRINLFSLLFHQVSS